jgi:hypothetical protein
VAGHGFASCSRRDESPVGEGGTHDNDHVRCRPHCAADRGSLQRFLSEGGKLYDRTRETAQAVGFYDNMRALIPAVRAAGVQVFIVPHHR